MKYFFLFVIFLLPMSFSYADEVYYCSEDKSAGFAPKDAYALRDFQTSRFKAYVDFDDKKFVSDEIYFGKDTRTKCKTNSVNPSLYCISAYGSAIAINRETLKFHHASVYNKSGQSDEIYIAHGSCEKF
jgi:hypothetical protein